MEYKLIHWSDDEIRKLIDNYPTASKKEIEDMLTGRSYNSIKQKAKSLNVKKLFVNRAHRKSKKVIQEKIVPQTRNIDTGIIFSRGNVTVHRMR